MKRVFLFVLDSFGIGAAPDAAAFGDEGANTLGRISKEAAFNAENLNALGLCEIEGIDCLEPNKSHSAAVCRLCECSAGKDTTVGHWEIAGLVSKSRFPTYPAGFPPELLEKIEQKIGKKFLCNRPYSGTDVLRDFGEEHIKSGNPILYTSADSVFQIAAHEKVIPLETLYEICQISREELKGEHAVARVIARPFNGEQGAFYRTAGRHDFSLAPTGKTLLDYLTESGKTVLAIGKIGDIFAGKGITEFIPTASNKEGMEAALSALSRDFCGLAFINLVDFDSAFGHREDAAGYAAAIAEFDGFLPTFLEKMREDDVLIITADHGCDPGDGSTDHTREYVPLLIYGKKIKPQNLGTRRGFSHIAATVAEYLGISNFTNCESLLKEIYKD